MKKLRNEKGFAMAELLAVCIIVLGIFAVLFSNYLPLTAEYENRVTYNNVNAEYAATYIRKAFKDVRIETKLTKTTLKSLDSNAKGYVTLYNCYNSESCDTSTLEKVFDLDNNVNQLNTIKKLINEYGIQEMILTRYKTDNVKQGYSKSGALSNYIEYIPTFKDSKITKTGKYRIILKTKDYGYATVPLRYAEPNEPELKGDLVPVYYDNGLWRVADSTNESITHGWYDYVEKHWANAVKLTGSCSKTVGSNVTSCIKSMWVWIPKYKYDKITTTSVKQIGVTFLTYKYTKTDVHPAFTGNAKNGFWIGKYENNGDIIKAGQTLTGSSSPQPASNSSIITNKEWGAVAYLAYSKYGTCNENGVNCTVIRNDNFTTGGAVNTSTTGNVYGVYDMNGGKYELVNGYDSRGDGTGTDEVDASNKVSHTFDHKFRCENCSGWCETISHYHPCSYNCGTAEKPKYCSCSYYTYTYVWHQDTDLIEDTNAPYKIVGGSGTNCSSIRRVDLAAKTAKGYTQHSWQTDMKNGDGECSGNYNLRGGSGDGNAWCIKNTVTNTSPKASNSSAKDDTGSYHYDVKSNTGSASYAGIFAYSSSDFVKSSYIVTRSVIK